MSLEYRQFVWPRENAADSDPRYTFELKRNRLRQPIRQQKFWIALKRAYPELAHELSPDYQAAMRRAIDSPDAPPDGTTTLTLTDDDQLHLRMFPLAVALSRLVSVVSQVTTDDPLFHGLAWSDSMPPDTIRALFEWFTDDPDRYDYVNEQVEALFNPNDAAIRPAHELTEEDLADPNSPSADGKPGAR